MKAHNIAFLGSTKGSLLAPLVKAITEELEDATPCLVITDRPSAPIIEKARQHQLALEILTPMPGESRYEYGVRLDQVLRRHRIDWVVLIGFMRILDGYLTQKWLGSMINTHPSLLPRHAGLMDMAVHQRVLDYKELETGCTVHLVDQQVDCGQIIHQSRVKVDDHDTAASLKVKVQGLEVPAIVDALAQLMLKQEII